MSLKKDQILQSALALFSSQGYQATSTSRVAKEAGVSEGLIFRHFTNKEGLLTALVEERNAKLKQLFDDILWDTHPKRMITKALSLPFQVAESDYPYWKLRYQLQWEIDIENKQLVESLSSALSIAFSRLGYKNSALEAQFILQIIEGMATGILKGEINNKEEMLDFLLKKYDLKN